LTAPLAVRGAPGSPYTRKMLAVLRYRRIAYRYLVGNPGDLGLPTAKVDMMPTVFFETPAGMEAAIDSTPIIRRLETTVTERSVIPRDPALAFLDELIEDYADEWLTKPMFHYRWAHAADAEQAKVLPRWRNPDADEPTARSLGEAFAARQIGRLGVVGSNAVTGPIIEASYLRLLDILTTLLAQRRFVFGARPASSDFGLYGQLSQLAKFEPTSMAITLQRSPRVFTWVDLVEDLSGLEPSDADWITRDAAQSLRPLLAEIGRTYVPVMLANAAAIADGAATVEATLDGARWIQTPFPYQAKCVAAIRSSFGRLSMGDQAFVSGLVAGSGCEPML